MVYKIQLSIQAKQDYTKIISYLKNDLMEANIAEKYANLINNEIYSLKVNPQKFAIIDDDNLKKYNLRKLIIKNYIAFYRVDENKKLVNAERILYNKMNWKNIL